MKIEPLSKSLYKEWETCPWRAHAFANLGFQSTSGQAAMDGSEYHELAERYYKEEITADQAVELATNEEVRDLLQTGFTIWPPNPNIEYICEERIYVNSKGKPVKGERGATAAGTLDLRYILDDILYVEDWKTGRWQRNNPIESWMYGGLLAHACHPEINEVVFRLRWVRTASEMETRFRFTDKGREVEIFKPDGKTERLYDTKGPFVGWINAIQGRIKSTKAEPRPGDHCNRYYGEPCQFRGAECPLNSALPAKIEEDGILAQRGSDIGRDFMVVLRQPETELSPTIASNAMIGIQQLEGGIKAVKKRIEAWSKTRGSAGEFFVGKDKYGLHTPRQKVLDKAYAIQMLVESDMPYEDMAKYLNPSISSMEKIPVTRYPEVKEAILTVGVDTLPGKEKWGKIPKEGDDGKDD